MTDPLWRELNTVSISGNSPSAEAGLTCRPHFPTAALDYALPDELIAQEPAADRSGSRLLVACRAGGTLADGAITDLPSYLHAGDALVLNDTRVLPAKFELRRRTGGRIEGLFLHAQSCGTWQVLLRGARRLAEGETLDFVTTRTVPWRVVAERRGERGHWALRVEGGVGPAEVLRAIGRMPLPPYIRRNRSGDERDPADMSRYQTVYAERDGAVAAPTAGLHFTPELLARVAAVGVTIVRVTLHVGYGTFAPLEVEDLADHRMHREHAEMSAEVARQVAAVRQEGGRVVAVGTTSARVLESAWLANRWQGGYAAETDLFCYPPYVFGGVDVLLTNFHLPRSTLLALVMAFADRALIHRAYAHAIAQRYRFFSYGDAMLIV